MLCGLQMLPGITLGAIMAINGDDQRRHLPGLCRAGRLADLADAQPGPLDRADFHRSGIFGRVMESSRRSANRWIGRPYLPASDCARASWSSTRLASNTIQDSQCCKDITFTCQPGQVVALLGSTGSGKTSLVNLLPRFHEYTSGSLKLDGVELNQYPRSFLRQPDRHRRTGAFPILTRRFARISPTVSADNVTQEEIEAAARQLPSTM